MDEVTSLFSTMHMTPALIDKIRAEATRSFERDQSIQSPNLKALPPDPATESKGFQSPEDDDNYGPAQHQALFKNMMEQSLHPRHAPPTALPCANVQADKYTACENLGTMACSACKLVSYCSKVRNKRLCPLRVSLNG